MITGAQYTTTWQLFKDILISGIDRKQGSCPMAAMHRSVFNGRYFGQLKTSSPRRSIQRDNRWP
jgi:hypothetical protein